MSGVSGGMLAVDGASADGLTCFTAFPGAGHFSIKAQAGEIAVRLNAWVEQVDKAEDGRAG